MKITRISVFQKNLPLTKPYWLSGGRLKFEVLDATFVKLETDEGVTGWGEGTPWGHTYLPAHGPGIRAGVETMAQAVLGLDPRRLTHVEQAMDLTLPGHLYAKAPIDLACWDILGKSTGRSIADCLGGCYPDGTPIASSISTDTPEGMVANIESWREQGYFVHSVKVGADVEMDIKRIRHIEANRLPHERILYDVNRAWTRRQALAVMNAVADLPVTFEQPGETLDDIAAIRPMTSGSISIDERLETLGDMTRIAAEGIAEVVNIKINRVGGLTKARRIRDLALAHGFDIYVMATGGSILADLEAAHLAQTIPTDRRLGVWSCQDMLDFDPAPERPPRIKGGHLTIDDTAGLGVSPDENLLGEPVAVYET